MEGIFRAIAQWFSHNLARLRARRWLRRTATILFAIIILYAIAGFFGAPYLLRRMLTGQVAASIQRPVTVGPIAFNPFRLRLELDRLHVGDRDPQRPFVDIGKLRVKLSWTSLFRLAPVVGEFYTDKLSVHIIRTGDQRFNFSDLIERPAAPAKPPKPPAGKLRFAFSNIQINDAAVDFDDRMVGQRHRIDHLRMAIPFIANLPSDVNIYVQPFLQMIVDGSRFSLNGYTRPFGRNMDTVVYLDLHRLQLADYMAYAPRTLPVKLSQGMLSALIELHFVNPGTRPQIRLEGGAAFESVDLRDHSDAPLLSLGRIVVNLQDVRPLENFVHLKRIYVDSLHTYLVRKADGTTNLTALAASNTSARPGSTAAGSAAPPAQIVQAAPRPAPPATPGVASSAAGSTPPPAVTGAGGTAATAAPSPAAQNPLMMQMQMAAPRPQGPGAPAPPPSNPGLDLALGSFEMVNSAVDFTDKSQPGPAALSLNAIGARLANLRTVGAGEAPFEFDARLASGGAISAKGKLDLADHQFTTDAGLNQIDLAALNGFAKPLMTGEVGSGKLTAQAVIKGVFAPGRLNVHVEPASASVENLVLKDAARADAIGWNRFAVSLGQFDLAARQVVINDVTTDALKLRVMRDRAGQLNLLGLTPKPATPTATTETASAPSLRRPVSGVVTAPNPAAPQQWRYQIASVTLNQAEIHSIDEHGPKPIKLDIVPLAVHIKDISNDLTKPIAISLDGTVNGKGGFKIDGTAAPSPLDARLRIVTRRIDLTVLNAFLSDQLNATIASAALTMNGTATATNRENHLRAGYSGDLTLGGVHLLDRLTGDTFLRLNSFAATRIAADYGEGRPKLRIGGLALANFYTRVILNSNGRLNLSDLTGSPQAAPVSITRPNEGAAPTASPRATPSPAATRAPPPSTRPLPAAIAIGGITLQGGRINYTDNFIQPHYSADLTDLAGKIDAFGTGSNSPAAVNINGMVIGAPLSIVGAINPLVPLAFVDIAAKANSIELPGLSPYSTKYTGYPIVKGALTVDVHYLLQNQQLTATNHIVLDQLTFGDKVESKSATNLPIRLAVALLKDSRGVIDLSIPVKGSLNDPQFSIGGVIWGAIKNLIVKAATAPFSLIAGMFGGGGNGAQLSYIEFAPGYAEITAEAGKKIDTIAKALTERPALKLDISGRVDPRVDSEGLRFAKVDREVRRQKIADAGLPENGAPVTLSQDEYDKYLKKAYKAAKFDKPRDLIGLPKSLPPDEMKKLMAAHEQVTEEDLHHLADARAGTVRTTLGQKVDPARLFIIPPKLSADDIKDGSKTTRADLALE